MNEDATQEDRRVAANITIVLSSQLMSASLAALGFAVAAWTYVADKREIHSCFRVFCVASFVAFVASIFVGGKGVAAVAGAGFQGQWQSTNASRKKFNTQALLSLLALLLFVCSVFFSRDKNDDIADRMTHLEKEVNVLRQTLGREKAP